MVRRGRAKELTGMHMSEILLTEGIGLKSEVERVVREGREEYSNNRDADE